MKNKIILSVIVCVVSSVITGVIISVIYQRRMDVLQDQYAQIWFERNMYAENYYREVGNDKLADSFDVTKTIED